MQVSASQGAMTGTPSSNPLEHPCNRRPVSQAEGEEQKQLTTPWSEAELFIVIPSWGGGYSSGNPIRESPLYDSHQPSMAWQTWVISYSTKEPLAVCYLFC
jgi:hypothetical protein